MTKTLADRIKKGCNKEFKCNCKEIEQLHYNQCGYDDWYCPQCISKAQGMKEAMEDFYIILTIDFNSSLKEVKYNKEYLESEIKKLKKITK